jgi:hypothetical protein
MKASVEHIRETFKASECACQLVGVAVSSFRFRTVRNDSRLRERLIELAGERPRFGYRRLHASAYGVRWTRALRAAASLACSTEQLASEARRAEYVATTGRILPALFD